MKYPEVYIKYDDRIRDQVQIVHHAFGVQELMNDQNNAFIINKIHYLQKKIDALERDPNCCNELCTKIMPPGQYSLPNLVQGVDVPYFKDAEEIKECITQFIHPNLREKFIGFMENDNEFNDYESKLDKNEVCLFYILFIFYLYFIYILFIYYLASKGFIEG